MNIAVTEGRKMAPNYDEAMPPESSREHMQSNSKSYFYEVPFRENGSTHRKLPTALRVLIASQGFSLQEILEELSES
jgi:hypothetical protein